MQKKTRQPGQSTISRFNPMPDLVLMSLEEKDVTWHEYLCCHTSSISITQFQCYDGVHRQLGQPSTSARS